MAPSTARPATKSERSKPKSRSSKAKRRGCRRRRRASSPYKTFISIRESREKTVRELVDSRFDWAHMFAEFGRVLPVGVSIGSMEGCVNQPSTTGWPRNKLLVRRLEREGGLEREHRLGDARGERAELHDHRLRAQPVARRAHAHGSQADERRQGSRTRERGQDGYEHRCQRRGRRRRELPQGQCGLLAASRFQPLPSPPPAPATPPASTKSVPASTPTSTSAHSTNAAAHANGKRRSVAARTSGRRAG